MPVRSAMVPVKPRNNIAKILTKDRIGCVACVSSIVVVTSVWFCCWI